MQKAKGEGKRQREKAKGKGESKRQREKAKGKGKRQKADKVEGKNFDSKELKIKLRA